MAGKKHRTGATAAGRGSAAARPVIEGGIRTLDAMVDEPSGPYQPEIALWVDASSGMVVATELLDPRESPEHRLQTAAAALVATLKQPPGRSARRADGARPERTNAGVILFHTGAPARVLVNDAALAAAVREALGQTDVPVEVRASLPTLEEAFASISESLSTPVSWMADERLLPPLFEAATAFERAAPWEYMSDYPPLAVELGDAGPEDGVDALYISILGAAGEVYGAACYYDSDGLRQHLREGMGAAVDDSEIDAALEELRRTGAPPVDAVPPEMLRTLVGGLLSRADQVAQQAGVGGQEDESFALPGTAVDAIVFSLTPVEETDPRYVQWLAEHGFRRKTGLIPTFFRSKEDGETRDLNDRETRAMTGVLQALNTFFTRHQTTLQEELPPEEPLTLAARIGAGNQKRTAMVTFPAPGFDWEEDPLPPATPEQVATLYRFRVTFRGQHTIWRRIELRGDQTLEDLHYAIQEAFGWDDDHLYSFFLSGRAWDDASEYTSPFGEGERQVDEYRLAMLPLKPRQQFLYIFDYGDELRHLIKLEAIIPGGVQDPEVYPQITERHGENEPQYPDLEEEEEEVEEEEEEEE
jgi:hypothetical protein